MPGVYRPYTLADVLGAIQGTNETNTDTSVSGVGYFAEDDETVSAADSATATVQALPGWSGGTWGTTGWS